MWRRMIPKHDARQLHPPAGGTNIHQHRACNRIAIESMLWRAGPRNHPLKEMHDASSDECDKCSGAQPRASASSTIADRLSYIASAHHEGGASFPWAISQAPARRHAQVRPLPAQGRWLRIEERPRRSDLWWRRQHVFVHLLVFNGGAQRSPRIKECVQLALVLELLHLAVLEAPGVVGVSDMQCRPSSFRSCASSCHT